MQPWMSEQGGSGCGRTVVGNRRKGGGRTRSMTNPFVRRQTPLSRILESQMGSERTKRRIRDKGV